MIADHIVEGLKKLSQQINRFIECKKVERSYKISSKDHLHQDETKKERPAAKKITKKKVAGKKIVSGLFQTIFH